LWKPLLEIAPGGSIESHRTVTDPRARTHRLVGRPQPVNFFKAYPITGQARPYGTITAPWPPRLLSEVFFKTFEVPRRWACKGFAGLLRDLAVQRAGKAMVERAASHRAALGTDRDVTSRANVILTHALAAQVARKLGDTLVVFPDALLLARINQIAPLLQSLPEQLLARRAVW
jgi:hypothetical protein